MTDPFHDVPPTPPLTGRWLLCIKQDAIGADFLAAWADNGTVVDLSLLSHMGAWLNAERQVAMLNEEYEAVAEAKRREARRDLTP